MPFPTVEWISKADGRRAQDQIPDRAAEYIPATNMLLINADFRIFDDMIHYFTDVYRTVPRAGEVVKSVVHEWFEQQLVEAVMAAHAFRRSPEWDDEDLKVLWSAEALTAVVCPRYHVFYSIKRRLGASLGRGLQDENTEAPVVVHEAAR